MVPAQGPSLRSPDVLKHLSPKFSKCPPVPGAGRSQWCHLGRAPSFQIPAFREFSNLLRSLLSLSSGVDKTLPEAPALAATRSSQGLVVRPSSRRVLYFVHHAVSFTGLCAIGLAE